MKSAQEYVSTTPWMDEVSERERPSLAMAEEILDYLSAHPRAADTVRGIAKWWLRREGLRDEVEEVLEYLVGKGLLHKTVKADGEAIYSLSKKI